MSTEKMNIIIKHPSYGDCFDLLYDIKTHMSNNAFHILDNPHDDIMERFTNMIKHLFYKEKTVIEAYDT